MVGSADSPCRYDGKPCRHCPGTKDEEEAGASLSRLEGIRLLERGRLEPPAPDADLALYQLSEGKVSAKPEIARSPQALTLAMLAERFAAAQATSLEANSLATVQIHLRHLRRSIGDDSSVRHFTLADLQGYVDRRARQRGRRGKPLSTATIRKEVTTLGAAWAWAVQHGTLEGNFPRSGVRYPKATERPPFQTWAEVERQIGHGGLPPDEQAELWDTLFLTLPEVRSPLDFVNVNACKPSLCPMLAFAAHTGARRSEILRSRIGDFDFDAGTVLVREKERVKGKVTTRRAPLSPFLASPPRDWLAGHSGGRCTFCQPEQVWKSKSKRSAPTPIHRDEAHDHLRRTLDDGNWSAVRGWHTSRRGFISNCAASGVDQRLIDAWVGHTTEEVRCRYRHPLPDQSAAAIRSEGVRKGNLLSAKSHGPSIKTNAIADGRARSLLFVVSIWANVSWAVAFLQNPFRAPFQAFRRGSRPSLRSRVSSPCEMIHSWALPRPQGRFSARTRPSRQYDSTR